MPVCSKCKIEKQEDEFSFKNKSKGIRLERCKSCHSAYIKEHYANNKEAYIARAKRDAYKVHKRLVEFVRSLKTHCTHCGEDHPAVLDFHHTDPNEKEIEISAAKSKKQVLREIQKCVVLCSNCHRKLHWTQNNMGS